MNDNIIKVLQEECIEEISFFSEVYLFGSSLCGTNPNDIDLLIIYEEGSDSHIEEKKGNIFDLLMSVMGIECHFVTLSKNEIDQTKFLNHVVHKKIIGLTQKRTGSNPHPHFGGLYGETNALGLLPVSA